MVNEGGNGDKPQPVSVCVCKSLYPVIFDDAPPAAGQNY